MGHCLGIAMWAFQCLCSYGSGSVTQAFPNALPVNPFSFFKWDTGQMWLIVVFGKWQICKAWPRGVSALCRAAGIDAQLPPALAPFPFYFQN